MQFTLKSFNTWQITLPKKWRSKFDTTLFLAKETDSWLLIQPITQKNDAVYYESKDWFWVYSQYWIDPNEIISKIRSLDNG